MDNTTPRILISCSILIIVGCLCLSFVTIGGVGIGVYEMNRAPSPTAAFPQMTRSAQTTPSTSLPTPTSNPESADPSVDVTSPQEGSEVTVEIADKMEEIEDQVVEIRGLTPIQDVPQVLLSSAELHELVVTDFFDDYTQEMAEDDGIALHAFGLLPEDYDLLGLYVDLYSESILGFYDQDVESMYILQNEDFRGTERMTYAHEYTHALQDQTYDLVDGLEYNDEACEDESERCAAIQALIEGDATLVEELWYYNYSSEQDQADVNQDMADYSSPVFDSAPTYIQQDSYFAYNQGFEFIYSLYEQGGWEAVNEAYVNPPVSTEQILHPGQYPQDEPVEVSLPDLAAELGKDWRLIEEETLGEWYTFLTLGYAYDESFCLAEDEAREAAAGWGGDRFAVYTRDSDGAVVLALLTEWDDANEARDFFEAFTNYGEARWGTAEEQRNHRMAWETPGETSVIVRDGKQTLWLLSPDAETSASLEALFEVR